MRFKPPMSKLQINREVMGGKHEVNYKERLMTGRESKVCLCRGRACKVSLWRVCTKDCVG